MVILCAMMMCVLLEDHRRSGRICCFHITGIVVCNGLQNDAKAVSSFGLQPVRHYFVDLN